MPYAIAHPAAAVALHRMLGRFSVPSALTIGAVIPDAWYLLPFLGRPDTHRASGLLLCLPLALAAYLVFHLLLKAPLLALLPARGAASLRGWTCKGLPRVGWIALLASLAAGIASHLAWDAFTHEGVLSRAWPLLRSEVLDWGPHPLRLYQALQHASTVAGTAFLLWWLRGKLAAAPSPAGVAPQPWPRAALALALVAVPAAVFGAWVIPAAADPGTGAFDLGGVLRAAAVHATEAFFLAALGYSLAWHLMAVARGRRL